MWDFVLTLQFCANWAGIDGANVSGLLSGFLFSKLFRLLKVIGFFFKSPRF